VWSWLLTSALTLTRLALYGLRRSCRHAHGRAARFLEALRGKCRQSLFRAMRVHAGLPGAAIKPLRVNAPVSHTQVHTCPTDHHHLIEFSSHSTAARIRLVVRACWSPSVQAFTLIDVPCVPRMGSASTAGGRWGAHRLPTVRVRRGRSLTPGRSLFSPRLAFVAATCLIRFG
jgi:hypothetical protein